MSLASSDGFDLARDRTFLCIWTGVFLGGTSSFLLLMSLSADVFSKTHSALVANAIVLTQWIPAVVALQFASRTPPRRLLINAELGSAIATTMIVIVRGDLALVFLLLILRGTCENISKIARPVALKHYFAGMQLDKATSHYTVATLLGGSVGALAGGVLLQRIDISIIVAISCVLNLIAAACYRVLSCRGTVDRSHAPVPAGSAEASAWLRPALVYFVAAVCLYQGFHNVARSVFPVRQLGLTEVGIPYIQTITNIAYCIGAIAAGRVILAPSGYLPRAVTAHCGGIAALSLLATTTEPAPGLLLYGAFAFFFELAYCIHLRFIIIAAPVAGFPHLMATINAWAMGSMVTTSIVGSVAVDRWGFAPVAIGFAGIAAAVPLAAAIARRTARLPADAPSS